MKLCRFCGSPLKFSFVDLGTSPLANSYINSSDLDKAEAYYPLRVFVCNQCFLVQLEEFIPPEHIFNDYAYYSSYSESWLRHCKDFAHTVIPKFNISTNSLVVEIASNDGYLLQFFLEKGIPVLGIEPAENVAKVAQEKGISTIVEFFGSNLAERMKNQQKKADLIVGNNVLAHVPNLNDFVGGLKILLNKNGIVTMEFPHLKKLMGKKQFDTIYHEHFSYFSFLAVEKVFSSHGLIIFDAEEIPTHGGSLRIYAGHDDIYGKQITTRVNVLRQSETDMGLDNIQGYLSFDNKVAGIKRKILDCLIHIKEEGKTIAGYGAPAKGNTLLNYCGIRTDFLDYTVDKNPYKQGRFLPGSRIPIEGIDKIRETRPDYVLILPWNIKDEITDQLSYIRSWGGKFIIPIPEVEVI